MKIWHSVKICSMPVRRGTAMVDRVKGVEKVTDNPFLNLYNFDVEKRNGKTGKYYVASRKKDPTQLKAATHKRIKSCL